MTAIQEIFSPLVYFGGILAMTKQSLLNQTMINFLVLRPLNLIQIVEKDLKVNLPKV